MDILTFALEKEEKAEALYRELAEKAEGGIKHILIMLADEEVHHIELIQKIQQQTDATLTSPTTLKEATALFTKMKEAGNAMEVGNISQLELYEKARQIELDSRDYYAAKSKEVKSEQEKELLITLSKEEQKHYVLMDNLCQLLQHPQTFLADAEFTHLEDDANEPF
jgi:rubrerythrin